MPSPNRKQIVSIVGARPQFIKLAALAPQLTRKFDHEIIHTGQHYDDNMSRLFFKQLGLPKVKLNLGVGGCSPALMTGRMIARLDSALTKISPDLVIVYGDTNSTLAGALAASKLNIPVAHVEAGMRSYVDDMPEEINRRLTDHCSALLFCSNPEAKRNLVREQTVGRALVSGDLMYDLLDSRRKELTQIARPIKQAGLERGEYLYLTVHRANTLESQERLTQLVNIIAEVNEPLVWPVHPHARNSLTKARLLSRLEKMSHVKLMPPLGYFDNMAAVKNARVVMTDSGGLQKEALFLGTPVLTLRAETEWNDTLKLGNRLVDLDPKKIKSGLSRPPEVKRIEYRVDKKRPSAIIAREIGKYLKGR
jgi:UDP-N-acetylglucosamine 2-epimerase